MHQYRLTFIPAIAIACLGACRNKTSPNLAPQTTEGAVNSASEGDERCDVIVAGGSTSALAAALGAAREFEQEKSHEGRPRVACLLEPTDWLGGQLTASGVPAIDFAHHSAGGLNLSKLTRNIANLPNAFTWLIESLASSSNGRFEMSNNPGQCWVSVRCFEPKTLIESINSQVSELAKKGYLRVFLNTVPKRVSKEGRFLRSVTAIRHAPKDGTMTASLWSRRLSTVLADWYSESESPVYKKEIIRFRGAVAERFPLFIDATEWGELLVLSGASYLQGVEASENSPLETNDTCGQAIVYPVAVELKAQETPLPQWWEGVASGIRYPQHYSINEPGRDFTWDDVWTYRRIRLGDQPASKGRRGVSSVSTGDVSSQNWTLGNDFPYRYLFLSKKSAAEQVDDWKGGVSLETLSEAEFHALGWFHFLREKAPVGVGPRLALSQAYGTANGLAKVPYIRDTRRSVGQGDFVLKYEGGIFQGSHFDDSIGIGAYAADVHPTKNSGCSMPPHVGSANPAPKAFELPFRAHTNKDFDNLLVSGKLMAQTFLANAATRLHPVEFSSGTGAGVAAAFMQKWQVGSGYIVQNKGSMGDIQIRIKAQHGPISFQNLNDAKE